MIGNRPISVGVNLLWLVPGVVGGSEEYTTRLLRALVDLAPDDLELTLFTLEPFAAAHPDLAAAVPTVVCPQVHRSKAARVTAECTWLAAQTARRRLDMVHHGGGTLPVFGSRPGIVTVHDLQPRLQPENFTPAKRWYLQFRLGPSVRQAALVVAVSEWTRRTIVDEFGVDPSRIAVVTSAPDPNKNGSAVPDLRRAYRLDGPFFLYPAITYPHKNHLVLVRAFARVAAARPGTLLVLTGGAASMEQAVLTESERLGVAGRVRRLGRVPAAELDRLYREAAALVFPSTFEGFGLPVLEAMSRGCPVVVADATALPSTAGGAGLLVPPDDVEAWSQAMTDVLDDGELRRRLVDAGHRRAAAFTWQESASKMAGAYRRVAAQAGVR